VLLGLGGIAVIKCGSAHFISIYFNQLTQRARNWKAARV
jgi:hypothetical protein